MTATLAKKSAARPTVSLRIKPEVRNLIDRAAKFRGKNRTDFILDAARAAAEETLLSSSLIVADGEAYTEFLARLDRPASPNARLSETMQTPAPWDSK